MFLEMNGVESSSKELSSTSLLWWSWGAFGNNKSRVKVGTFAIIFLLALWSILSGCAGIARRRSVGYPFYDDTFDTVLQEVDIDALEMEAREKLVSHMWDKYNKCSSRFKLSSFWQDAFEAAYQELESEDLTAVNAAIHEIAKLSVHFFQIDSKTESLKYATDLTFPPRSSQK